MPVRQRRGWLWSMSRPMPKKITPPAIRKALTVMPKSSSSCAPNHAKAVRMQKATTSARSSVRRFCRTSMWEVNPLKKGMQPRGSITAKSEEMARSMKPIMGVPSGRRGGIAARPRLTGGGRYAWPPARQGNSRDARISRLSVASFLR